MRAIRDLQLLGRTKSRAHKGRARRPAVEGLEQRSLLSAVHHAHHAMIHVSNHLAGKSSSEQHARVSISDHHGEKANSFQQTNLVSDQAGVAQIQDTNLVNSWGVAFSSTSPFWVSDNMTGVSTLYRVAKDPMTNQDTVTKVPLTVSIPLPTGVMPPPPAAPTGIVHNGTSDFVVSQGTGTAKKSGPGIFIFSTEDGTISAWNPTVDPTHAILAVDNSGAGAVYKGLAMASSGGANFLYASNIHDGTIDVFDTNFQPATQF